MDAEIVLCEEVMAVGWGITAKCTPGSVGVGYRDIRVTAIWVDRIHSQTFLL